MRQTVQSHGLLDIGLHPDTSYDNVIQFSRKLLINEFYLDETPCYIMLQHVSKKLKQQAYSPKLTK